MDVFTAYVFMHVQLKGPKSRKSRLIPNRSSSLGSVEVVLKPVWEFKQTALTYRDSRDSLLVRVPDS